MPFDYIEDLCSQIGDEFIAGRTVNLESLLQNYPELLELKIQRRFVAELRYLASTAQPPELAQQYNDLRFQLQNRNERGWGKSRQRISHINLEERKAELEELFWEQKINEDFFRVNKPLLPNHRASDLYGQIDKNVTTHNKETIVLDGYSTRAVILALVKIIAKYGLFPTLIFQIGNTRIMCQTAPRSARQRQKANLFMHVLELPNEYFPYGDWVRQKGDTTKYGVGHYLNFIVGTDEYRQNRTIRLMQLMKEKSRNIASFQIAEFDNSGLIKDTPDPIPTFLSEDIIRKIHYLNGLNFLRTVVEITRRLYRENGAVYQYGKENPDRQAWFAKGTISDGMPIAILQARACKLLEEGFLDLNDVFGGTNETGTTYGITTGKKTIDRIEELKTRASEINEETRKLLFNSKFGNRFNTATPFSPMPTNLSPGRTYMKDELGSTYGGDSESTGLDYSRETIKSSTLK